MACAYGVAVVVADVTFGRHSPLTGLLAIVPVLAAFGSSAPVTAFLAIPVLVLAATNMFGIDHTDASLTVLHTAGVAMGSLLGIAAAADRDGRAAAEAIRRRAEAGRERAWIAAEVVARRYATAAALAQAIQPDEVVRAVAAHAVPELGQSIVSLWLVDGTGDSIRFAGGYGHDEDVPARVGPVSIDSDLPVALAVRTGEPVVYRSRAERNERWPVLADVTGQGEATAVMPLVVGDVRLGCLSFGFNEVTDLTPQSLRVLDAVTSECALALDRTRLFQAERTARQTLEFLAAATELLVTSPDPDELVRRLVDLAVPALADWCAVYLGEPDGLQQVAASIAGDDGRATSRQLTSAARLDYDSANPACLAWRTGQTQPISDVQASVDAADRPVDSGTAAPPRLTSGLAVPIRARGEIVGVMTTGYGEGRGGQLQDRYALDGLAARAGVALDNARRLYDQGQTVEALTSALLPATLPEVAGYRLDARLSPTSGQVCGDWYEAALLPGGELLLGVGDAAGHGIEASSTVAAFRNVATSQALTGASPAQILDVLAELARLRRTDVAATALYLRLDPPSGRLVLASAGHPPAVLLRADGQAEELALEPGMPLGAARPEPHTDRLGQLNRGDTLVIVTDGVIERRGEALKAGIDRLTARLRVSPGRITDHLAEEIIADQCGDHGEGCCVVVLTRTP